VERAFLPPAMIQQLAEAAPGQGAGSLKEIITSGEQLKITPAVQKLFQQLPGCALENQYGPSESHVVTAHRLEGDSRQWPQLPPIGHPIGNTQIYVLDRSLEPAAVGVVGELFIGGESLARGYLQRPDLTAGKFLPNHFSHQPGARLYRTGDLAKWDGTGNLHFVGRNDLQINFRGYRIELGEIEAALLEHGDVKQAAVALQEGPVGKRLVAYVARSESKEAAGSNLAIFLQKRLPEYMVPGAWVNLERLPVLPGGEVDRAALKPPAGWPRTETERKLVAIWAGILRMDEVGVQDDFFQLGGHSLMGTQMITQIRDSFQVELPLRRLFEAPTIALLAEVLEPLLQSTGTGAATEEGRQIQRVARKTVPVPAGRR
jgi:acyl-CoA synthetase (AMP-forming)/AMP-acid ligase II/acyl carrier protein